jgi:hypothetical protein
VNSHSYDIRLTSAEAELTAYGLTLPETTVAHGWAMTRTLRVKDRMFAIFGDKRGSVSGLVGPVLGVE